MAGGKTGIGKAKSRQTNKKNRLGINARQKAGFPAKAGRRRPPHIRSEIDKRTGKRNWITATQKESEAIKEQYGGGRSSDRFLITIGDKMKTGLHPDLTKIQQSCLTSYTKTGVRDMRNKKPYRTASQKQIARQKATQETDGVWRAKNAPVSYHK